MLIRLNKEEVAPCTTVEGHVYSKRLDLLKGESHPLRNLCLSIPRLRIFDSSVEDGKPSGNGVSPNRVDGGVLAGVARAVAASRRRTASSRLGYLLGLSSLLMRQMTKQ